MESPADSPRTSSPSQAEAAIRTDERPFESTPISELHSLFKAQKEAFRLHSYPSLEERIEALRTIESMIKNRRKDVEAALEEDFCTHPPQLSAMVELLGQCP